MCRDPASAELIAHAAFVLTHIDNAQANQLSYSAREVGSSGVPPLWQASATQVNAGDDGAHQSGMR